MDGESYVHTFPGGQIEVEVDNVGASPVTRRGAELGSELRLEERVRGDADGIPIDPAGAHALVSLDVPRHPLHHDLRRPALVLDPTVLVRVRLQQASLPRGRD